MVDRRLAGIFNLENIDILDYRIAGNILETAGDTIVDLSKSISETSLSSSEQKKMYDIAKDILAEEIEHESWFLELLYARPSGHMRRKYSGERPHTGKHSRSLDSL